MTKRALPTNLKAAGLDGTVAIDDADADTAYVCRIFSLDDREIAPANAYGKSKAEAGRIARALAHRYNVYKDLVAALHELLRDIDEAETVGQGTYTAARAIVTKAKAGETP